MDEKMMNETQEEVTEVVNSCFEEAPEGGYKTKDEVIDAVVAKLEGLRETEGMGGLGTEEDGMKLPEEEAEDEEA